MKEYMKLISSIDEFDTIFQGSRISVFVFSASWCPDCRFIEPFMKSFVEKYSSYDFYYVDRDEYMEICQRLMVMGIPSFVAVKDGKEIGRFVSKLRKTEAEIDQFLQDLQRS